jgi:peptide/nickel transport system substrate-binding protein
MAGVLKCWALAGTLLLAGCGDEESGPIAVAAIGGPPRIANPNLERLDAPTSFAMQAAAQGLVRFDASGEIEPALAQRWIVSDDGRRYIFRLARAEWPGGGRVTAEQVAARLRAAASPASKNPLKPLLGAIEEIVAVSEVIEISLHSPRPNFLQLLAQPEMAIVRNGRGSGPYRTETRGDGGLVLTLPAPPQDEEEVEREAAPPEVVVTGARAPVAVARFAEREADLVLGGTVGDLPIARAARVAGAQLVFDPAAGLFGLSFGSAEGRLARPEVRQALAMAIDRPALLATLGVPGLQAQESFFVPGIEGLAPALPAWAALPLGERRAAARATLSQEPERLRLRVAMPDGPGYRLVFAHLARDWAAVGVAAERVALTDAAELRLIDTVAPLALASWYLRHFACNASRICDPAADEMLAAARIAPTAANRRGLLANADRIMTAATPFIPLASPVRWSLVSPRLTGFRPNRFARHSPAELIRRDP